MVMQLCMGFMKGDQDQAKDLTQEVFIQVWNNLGKFRQDATPKTWIYRITVNTCLNFLKKQKNKDQKLGEIMRDQETTEEIEFTETDPSKMLFEAMGKLSEIDRLVTGLLLDDVPQEEIATILGITEGNLRVKIHRIKLRLKKLIDHE
ncbi:sigma-70 family RNA polymerase sigma factor [Algoriphagus confluentis]|uniref:Sigma-70 family RNA polymerase sigma factor n=2 Tax=Algoriphagus confluentis TaxID=1697556 RepID=A0ABQ6PST1_9BACT|nr:sigma-70 family RNA polymerase sigma factor [Algoriphagus confluentis]